MALRDGVLMAKITWPPRTNPPAGGGTVKPPKFPPGPSIPPGTPPVPLPGGTAVPPYVPPPPKDTGPPQQYQDGWWSDGWVVVRQTGGRIVLTLSNGGSLSVNVQAVGESAPVIVNNIMGVIGAAARPTQSEPWPPARQEPQKSSSKEQLLATNVTDAEKLDLLLAVAEQTARDVADVRQVLVTYQEPATDDEPTDIWDAAFNSAEEPAGLDVPLESYDAARFAQYLVYQRSILNGTRVYPDRRRVLLARALVTGGLLDAQGEVYADLVIKWQVDRDVAIAALLTGLVDPYDTSFSARLERDVAQLAGTIKPETLSTGEVIPRFQRLDLEGVYRKLMPSGSGGQAGQGGEG